MLGKGPLHVHDWGGRGREISFATASDGLSNTLWGSEKVSSSGNGDRRIRVGAAANLGDELNTLAACAARRGAGGMLSGDVMNNASGRSWASDWWWNIAFMTGLPPNAPSCCESTDDSHVAIITASSNHPGGVNFVRCDGSCGFASDSIDTGNPNQALGASLGHTGRSLDWNGASDRGTWGAMATPDGGESRSL